MDEGPKRILLIGEPILDVTEEVVEPHRVRSAVRNTHIIYQHKAPARSSLGGVFYLGRFLSHFSHVDIIYPHPKTVDSNNDYSNLIEDLKHLSEYTVYPVESISHLYKVRRTLWVQDDSASGASEAVQILRVDSAIPSRVLNKDEEDQIIQKLNDLLSQEHIRQYDAILVTDYDLGLFTDEFVRRLSETLANLLRPEIDIIVYTGKSWSKYSSLHKSYIVSDYEEALGVLDNFADDIQNTDGEKNKPIELIARCFPNFSGVVLAKSCHVHAGSWQIHGNRIYGSVFEYDNSKDCMIAPVGYRGLTAAWLTLGLAYGYEIPQALRYAHDAAIHGQLNLNDKLRYGKPTIDKLRAKIERSKHFQGTIHGRMFDVSISQDTHQDRINLSSSFHDEIIKVSICYPRELEKDRKIIKNIFSRDVRDSLIKVWSDENIGAGEVWEESIRANLKSSDLIILLMSMDFLESSFCMKEMEYAIQRIKEGSERGVTVVPVMCEFIDEPNLNRLNELNKLNRLPKKKRFLSDYDDRSAGYDEVAEELLNVVERIRNKRSEHLNNITELDKVKKTYRDNRLELTWRVMEYYSKYYKGAGLDFFYKESGIPVLCKKEWIPEEPISLETLDHKIRLVEKKVQSPPAPNPSFVVNRRETESAKQYNGDLYRLLDFDGVNFTFCRGKYYDFLDTCECLGLELAQAFSQNIFSSEGWVERNVLPARDATGVLNFHDRSTAFGTCTLVVLIQYDGNHKFLLNIRSEDLSETPGLFHVVPAGTFQPALSNGEFIEEDFSFTQNIFREFVEELIDDEYLRYNPEQKFRFKELLKTEARDFINKVRERELYELWHLGTVLDPVNLKPEILTIMFIDERDTDFPYWKLSWETRKKSGGLIKEPFTKNHIANVLNKYQFVPTGRAHLYLVQNRFEFLENRLHMLKNNLI